MSIRWLLAIALCAQSACYSQERHARSLRNACPEYRNLKCLSEVVCNSTERGCDSCSCDVLVPDNRPGYGNKR